MISAFYSDPHFCHGIGKERNIVTLAGRPFSSVEEMDEQLIIRYNDRIGMNDTVLWLGDAFLCHKEKAKEIMGRLNGYKLLINGNHDKNIKTMVECGFDLVTHQVSIYIAGHTCRCCHYPYAGVEHNKGIDDRYLERRPERRKGELLIHGHTHINRKINNNMIHVGVDAWDFRPVLYDEMVQLIRKHFPNQDDE